MMEWKQYKLGDVLTIKYGKDHKKLADGLIPVYGSGGIMRYADTCIYDKPSILIPRKGSLNNIFYVDKPFWTVDTMFWSMIDTNVVDPYFLYCAICKYDFAGLNVGSAVPSLTVPIIEAVELSLPPLPTQRRIAAILSSLDAQIENNNRINRNLEAQAQALFKSWFVDFEPWGGVMPEGWKEGKLGEIAQIIMGQSPEGKTLNSNGNGTIFYQGSADFGFRFPSVRIFSTNPTRYAEQNSVLMSVRAPVGDVNVALTTCAIGRGLCSIKALGDYQSFILYLVKSLKPQLDSFNGEGSVFGSINRKSLEEMPVICPSNDVVMEFESKVTPLDNQIRNNTEANLRLASLRDTLLPKLMKGEIEV